MPHDDRLIDTPAEHRRFGHQVQRRTAAQIAEITRWIEAQATPFTTGDLHQAMHEFMRAGHNRRASFSTTYNRLRELREEDLVRQVNHPDAHTPYWLHIRHLPGATPG